MGLGSVGRVDTSELEHYLTPGVLTTLPADVVAGPARDVDAARAAVQAVLVHAYWLGAYGLAPEAARNDEPQVRPAAEMVWRLDAPSGEPLWQPRPAARRFQCTCRSFSVLYVALLRAAGVPARARCGFARYFEAGRLVDHWVVERWDGARWVRDDPQLDAVQVEALQLDFDPYDQPAGHFLTGGEAWLAVRAGEIDPEACGIGDVAGDWFVLGNVVRDLAAVSGMELLPWDAWGAMPGPGEPYDPAWYDEVARLTGADDLAPARARYAADPALRVPPRITSFVGGRMVEVELAL